MTQQSKAKRAAQYLFDAHRDRQHYQPLPDDISPATIEEAYDMQEAFQSLLAPGAWGHRGLQDSADHSSNAADGGLRRPLRRRGLRERRASLPGVGEIQRFRPPGRGMRSCGAAAIRTARQRRALRTGRRGCCGGRADACLRAGGRPGAPITGNLYFLGVAADNAWNAGVVLGPERTDWQSLDLEKCPRSNDHQRRARRRRLRGATCWATRWTRWPGWPTPWPDAARS